MSWNRNVKFYCVMWCTGSSKWGVRWGPSFLLEYRYCGRFAPAVPPAVFVLLRAVPRSLSSFVCRFCPCLPCRVLWGRPVAPGFPVVGGFSASAVRVLPSSLVASFGCVSVRSSRFVARCGGWCLLVLPSFLFFACFRSLRVWLLRVRLRCVLWFRRRFPPSSSGWLLRCPRLPPPPVGVSFLFFLSAVLLGWLPCRCLWSLVLPPGLCLLSFALRCLLRGRVFLACFFDSASPLCVLVSLARRLRVGCGGCGIVSVVLVAFVWNLVVWVCLCGCAFRSSGSRLVALFCFLVVGCSPGLLAPFGFLFFALWKKIVAASRPLCLRRFFCVCLALPPP